MADTTRLRDKPATSAHGEDDAGHAAFAIPPDQAQALLAAIVDSSTDAIISKTLEGIILSWNKAAERLYGYAAAEAVGQPITLIIPPELHDEERAILKRLWRGETIDPFETVRVTKDGRRIDISLTISPVRDASGRIIAASKIARDISDRKRFEEALREETRTAETLNRIGSLLAAELDVKRILQSVTDEARAVTGAEFAAFFYNAVDEQDEAYALYTLSGAPAEAFSSFPMPRSTAIFAPTFNGEGAVRIDDVRRDVRYGKSNPYHGLPPGHLPVTSYLAVPVIARSGEVLGGLFFGHVQPGVFTARHEQIIAGIAAQAAIAIDNANLYARVQESEQRFRQLAEHATDVFWIFDVAESRIVYVSPAYLDVWGRDCESLYADPGSFLDSVHPHDRERVRAAMARQRRGETTAEEYRLIHDDGSLYWVWDRAFPIQDDTGALVRIAGIAEDITERKTAEDRLRESEESYRRLTELLPVAVYACEAPSGIITYYNDRAVELWGREPALGDSDERYCGSGRLFLPDGRPLAHEDCPMAQALRGGGSFRNEEVVIERPDASQITALVNIEPIRDLAGHVVGAINVCLDVTALKHAEQQLREADRRKDEFLATLSHELRNPLAPLRFALEIIGRSEDDGQRLRQSREMLERQVAKMVRLIDDLLDVSRITHDKLELRREHVEVSTIVREAVESSRPAIEDAGHSLAVVLPDEPLWLHADEVRVAQVLGNLLSNACKYTPSGGEIRLTAESRDGDVLLSVEDNGRGIPPDDLDSIFEMFAQSESSQREQRGLGVGLTLVKRLVEMHGGSMRAFSEGPGKGSTFAVTLPAAAAAHEVPERKAPPRADARPAAGRRVLVVDDNHDSAATLAMLLEMTGHETLTTHDGAESVEAAERFRPDVVLLDLGLPGMDGFEVCRAIRSRPWSRHTTMVAVTGWGQTDDRRKSEEAGFDAHLVKPVGYSDIESLLHRS